jgi:oxalate decarboxylase/phosphoglucose isomerase-like protein (cupin superfamily)|tara:strand:+ start:41 stop:466 length:426 start_codon:yes stop_codon:yes gene_type:complete
MLNEKIEDIRYNNELYASYFNLENISDGLQFLTQDDSYIQVGTWKYEKGKILEAHYHNKFERSSYITQEVVYVIKGSILCSIFTKNGKFIESKIVNQNTLIIQYQGVHEYEILENSQIIEIKNGPYFGPEKDRTRVNVKKN